MLLKSFKTLTNILAQNLLFGVLCIERVSYKYCYRKSECRLWSNSRKKSTSKEDFQVSSLCSKINASAVHWTPSFLSFLPDLTAAGTIHWLRLKLSTFSSFPSGGRQMVLRAGRLACDAWGNLIKAIVLYAWLPHKLIYTQSIVWLTTTISKWPLISHFRTFFV